MKLKKKFLSTRPRSMFISMLMYFINSTILRYLPLIQPKENDDLMMNLKYDKKTIRKKR